MLTIDSWTSVVQIDFKVLETPVQSLHDVLIGEAPNRPALSFGHILTIPVRLVSFVIKMVSARIALHQHLSSSFDIYQAKVEMKSDDIVFRYGEPKLPRSMPMNLGE
jgi:hypothetical protein